MDMSLKFPQSFFSYYFSSEVGHINMRRDYSGNVLVVVLLFSSMDSQKKPLIK